MFSGNLQLSSFSLSGTVSWAVKGKLSSEVKPPSPMWGLGFLSQRHGHVGNRTGRFLPPGLCPVLISRRRRGLPKAVAGGLVGKPALHLWEGEWRVAPHFPNNLQIDRGDCYPLCLFFSLTEGKNAGQAGALSRQAEIHCPLCFLRFLLSSASLGEEHGAAELPTAGWVGKDGGNPFGFGAGTA